MKTISKILFCVFLILSISPISAQSGYGNSNPYGGNSRYGGSNPSSQMNRMDSQLDAPKEVPVAVTVGKIVTNLKKELTLDALQELVISNILTKTIKRETAIQKQEISDEDKIKESTALGEMTDLEIMDVLNKEQKARYLILSEERKSKMDHRKR